MLWTSFITKDSRDAALEPLSALPGTRRHVCASIGVLGWALIDDIRSGSVAEWLHSLSARDISNACRVLHNVSLRSTAGRLTISSPPCICALVRRADSA